MESTLFVRALSFEEEYRLKRRVAGKDVFAMRRAQMILASARGVSVRFISEQVGRSQPTVRAVIHGFNLHGTASLRRGSHRPKSASATLDASACQALSDLAHRSPREFGQARSLWSLGSLAQVAWEQGVTTRLVSRDTLRRALGRAGVSWKRAKAWIVSPDPHYERKKEGASA